MLEYFMSQSVLIERLREYSIKIIRLEAELTRLQLGPSPNEAANKIAHLETRIKELTDERLLMDDLHRLAPYLHDAAAYLFDLIRSKAKPNVSND